MKQQKYLFIDRDGTLIKEPEDEQIDSLDKLDFLPGVFSALPKLQQAGYKLIMISNQDGLGTQSFPQEDFDIPHNFMLKIFESQNIIFDDIKICPHLPDDNCECRKPKVGLLLDYLVDQSIDRNNSYVIGDRDSDLELAKNLKINGIKVDDKTDWKEITSLILDKPRSATAKRTTKETDILVSINLDQPNNINVDTGIRFFDHMLEQVVKHANISADIKVQGDLDIDDHHTVEDTGIAFGTCLKEALGDKLGIARFGFTVPMDEAQAAVALDFSGRSYCQFNCDFTRDKVGDLSTEMVSHFFRSFAEALQATLHIDVDGTNAHHMCESAFKGLGRALRQATQREGHSLPSTKGLL